jgi:8-oxo-dGTP diphosphatase
MKPVTPPLTVDAVIIYENKLVLIRRRNPPFQRQFALPGGFVVVGETVEAAVIREAKEETGLDIEPVKLLGVYSEPSRDPREHTVSVVFLARGSGILKPDSDALDLGLFKFTEIPGLAFDHNKIIENAKSDINGILY